MGAASLDDILASVEAAFNGEVGSLRYQLGRAIAENAGRKSDIVLKLSFKPIGDRVLVSAALSAKQRERVAKPKPASYFVNGPELSAVDPRQPSLPLDYPEEENGRDVVDDIPFGDD